MMVLPPSLSMDQSHSSPASTIPCRHCGEPHPTSFSHCPRTGRSLTSGRALVGRVIANRYRILALIGEGGMGAVYVAEHLLIGRKVAVKRLHPELASDEKAIARLEREARAAGSTGHENVVEILDLGFADDGAPFLVMEYLRGRSLAELLETHVQLAPERACRIAGQVLAALEAVHERGIVHRDLKPDNIILTRRRGDPEFVKVVDFGISKVRPVEGEAPLDLTRTGVMLGTPFYMSPEQARGMKTLDHRLDLFAVGVILYESIGGQLPFEGENYHQLLQAILTGKHTPIRSLCSDLDAGLAAVIERSIALEPEDRFQTAREMRQALVPYGATDRPTASSEAPPPTSRASAPSAQTLDAPPEPDREPPAARASTPWERDPDAEPVTHKRAKPRPTPRPRGIAHRPRTLGDHPRYFVAQSESWIAPSTVRPPAPEAPAPPVERQALMQTQPDAPPGRTSVKGSLVLSALDFLTELGPGAVEGVLARLDRDRAARIRDVKLPMSWLDLDDYAALLVEAERLHGSGDGGLAVRLGRATAERELTTTYRLLMSDTSPLEVVERLPRLFRSYHSHGALRLQRVGGSYRLYSEDLEPDTLPHALMFSGFCQRMVEMAGGSEVRASVVSCRGRGDDGTVTALRWK